MISILKFDCNLCENKSPKYKVLKCHRNREHEDKIQLIQENKESGSENILEKQTTEIKIVSEEKEETFMESEESEYESDEIEEFICNKCKKIFETDEELDEHIEAMCLLCFREGRLCVELTNFKTCYL